MSGMQPDWKLLKELDCPVCTEYMASPIKMCENGHSICGDCKERLTVCPTCRGTFVNVRNITLENLAAAAIYPCKYQDAGCKENFTLDERNKHLSVCLYQSRKCPVSVILGVDCSWTGDLFHMLVHIRAEHANVIAKVPGHFNVIMLDLVRQRVYFQMLLVLGSFFWLICCSENKEFKFTVLHVHFKEGSEAFKYGIKIGNSEEYIAVTRKCQSYLHVDLKALERKNSVVISYDTVLDFVNESGCLSCEIEIRREKLNGFVLEELQEHLEVVYAIGSVLN